MRQVVFFPLSLFFAESSVIKVRAPHEEPTPEQPRTSESSKGKEVDPLFLGVEDFLTMFESSSGEVCSSSFA